MPSSVLNIALADPSSLERRWRTIEAKIEAVAHELEHSGCIASQSKDGRRAWSLRYSSHQDGRTVQRAIYLGAAPAIVERARRLLKTYRERRFWSEQASRYGAFAASLVLRFQRPGRRLADVPV